MFHQEEISHRLNDSVEFVRLHLNGPVQTLVIGRPGLDLSPSGLKQTWTAPYAEVSGYPVRGASGSEGIISEHRSDDGAFGVLVFSRRPHFYEGYEEWELGYPVHLAAALGVRILLTFSAAGGLKGSYYPGLFVLIEGFINFAQVSPLRGLRNDSGDYFFASMEGMPTRSLAELVERAARETGERLSRGTYIMVRGPQFETQAELAMFNSLGADLIGMSTVPELICALAHGMETMPLALITNLPLRAPAADEEVRAQVLSAGERTGKFLNRILDLLHLELQNDRQ